MITIFHVVLPRWDSLSLSLTHSQFTRACCYYYCCCCWYYYYFIIFTVDDDIERASDDHFNMHFFPLLLNHNLCLQIAPCVRTFLSEHATIFLYILIHAFFSLLGTNNKKIKFILSADLAFVCALWALLLSLNSTHCISFHFSFTYFLVSRERERKNNNNEFHYRTFISFRMCFFFYSFFLFSVWLVEK